MNQDKEEQKFILAQEIMTLAQQKIVSQLRFMSSAVMEVELAQRERKGRPVTNGKTIWYHPETVLADFKQETTLPSRQLLHSLLHCLFGHPFVRQKQEKKLWDLCCDLAVEEVILSLELPEFVLKEDGKRTEILNKVKELVPVISAENLYNFYVTHRSELETIAKEKELFGFDDHRLFAEWIKSPKEQAPVNASDLVPVETESSEDEEEDLRKVNGEEELFDKIRSRDLEETRKKWKLISKKAELDLEIFNKKYGKKAGSFYQQMKPVTFEEVDYGEFLRNFGAQQEIMHLSDDAFDLSYYMYGLQIYGNIPLIEALEYSDEKRISNFVIAIDTSGSVQGEIVQNFLQKTCDVLYQTGSFTRLVNIYLVQCDAEIQSVEHITDLDELNELIPKLRLRGFGGTDFRPVFDYVEQLKREHQLEKLDGLLYFTDGVGVYPEKEPDYKTAFIFNRDDYISPNVPEWAIKAVLSSDTIRTLK